MNHRYYDQVSTKLTEDTGEHRPLKLKLRGLCRPLVVSCSKYNDGTAEAPASSFSCLNEGENGKIN